MQLLTPRGMVTWERNESSSTIDLTMASNRLFEDRISCKTWDNEYGSDHRAIHSAMSLGDMPEEAQSDRYLLQKANWKAIRETIGRTLVTSAFPTTNVDDMQEYIQSTTQSAIRDHCPKAKPYAFAKRWWTADLTALRKNHTGTHNLARARRRHGRFDIELEMATKRARHEFHHTIKKRKKEHWTEFLDDTTNV